MLTGLSPEYLDEPWMVDLALAPLLADVRQRGAHVLVVTRQDLLGEDRSKVPELRDHLQVGFGEDPRGG